MYQDYFGIPDSPFSIAPDPRYLYLSESHQEAIGHLLYGIRSAGGFVVLTGEVGTGKTTVCRAILQKLPENTDVAFIINPRMTVLELLTGVCDELGIDYPGNGDSIKALVDSLNTFLLSNHAQGRNTLLIIDEAQNLSAEVLEQVRLLTNLETSEKKLLQLVLIGQPELDELLASNRLRQLSQRVTARYRLQPLSRAVVERYIAHRLKVAGFYGELFTPGAIRRIRWATRGIPRLINILCERCMMAAYALEAEAINERIVRQALSELRSPDFNTGGRFRQLLGGISLVLGIVTVLLVSAQRSGWQPLTALSGLPGADTVRIFDTEQTALTALLEHWGVRGGGVGHACSIAAGHGLQCLRREGDWHQFVVYNRPGILRLTAGRWLLVTSGHSDTARLPVAKPGEPWRGRFVVLWRPPAGAKLTADDPVVVKDLVGLYGALPDYSWTVDQAAVSASAGGHFEWLVASAPLHYRFREKGTVDSLLHARLRRFQSSRQLPVTGGVDTRTWMKLNEAAGLSVPTLTSSG